MTPLLLGVLSALIELVCTAVFARLQTRDAFVKRPAWIRQLMVGCAFGLAAAAATALGYEADGASVNLRDAAPLIAGLLFGGPAGILAGAIGGAVRFAAASWGVGIYTQVACTISTVGAGFLAAALRRWFFSGRLPAPQYGFLIGAAMEAAHMLLIFLTHLNAVERALLCVQQCALPMMLGTGICVAAAVAVVRKADPAAVSAHKGTSLEAHLQRSLAICLLGSLGAAIVLTWGVQSMLAVEDTESLLRVHLRDVPEALSDALESALCEYTVWTGEAYEADSAAILASDDPQTGILTILIADPEGEVTASTNPRAVGLDLAANEETRPYLAAGEDGMTGPRTESFLTPGTLVRCGAVRLADGDILIAEYADAFVAEQLYRQIVLGALHRHIGTNGYLILADADEIVLSGPCGVGESLPELGFTLDGPEATMLTADIDGEVMQYMYAGMDTAAGRCIGICMIPKSETDQNALVDIYLTVFSVILIFFALFLVLSVLIRNRVVGEIHSVNSALGEITAGNLTRSVDVRSSDEFNVLSDGINATVAALQKLIAKEAARIDAELELARVIQRTSLPSVFPAFPGHTEFEIFAMMVPAREVGGDFYDFYLLGEDRLAFLAADVSDKGVPAAMFMMRAKTELKRLAESGLPLAEVFQRVNAVLCENNEASMFVTVWMGILDLRAGMLEYVDAGHEPAILVRTSGEAAFMEGTSGFVLGGFDGFSYTSNRLTLEPGDTIVLYTDGVTEAQNARMEQFGDERLLDSARRSSGHPVQDICQSVHKDVTAFVAGAEQSDDLTLLVLRFVGPDRSGNREGADDPDIVS